MAGVLTGGRPPAARGEAAAGHEDLQELWTERVAIMMYEGTLSRGEAERLAWVALQAERATRSCQALLGRVGGVQGAGAQTGGTGHETACLSLSISVCCRPS